MDEDWDELAEEDAIGPMGGRGHVVVVRLDGAGQAIMAVCMAVV